MKVAITPKFNPRSSRKKSGKRSTSVRQPSLRENNPVANSKQEDAAGSFSLPTGGRFKAKISVSCLLNFSRFHQVYPAEDETVKDLTCNLGST